MQFVKKLLGPEMGPKSGHLHVVGNLKSDSGRTRTRNAGREGTEADGEEEERRGGEGRAGQPPATLQSQPLSLYEHRTGAIGEG